MAHIPKTLKRYNHYRKKSDLVVIKYGAEWCGPCKKIKKFYNEIAGKEEYKNIYFLDVDIDIDEINEHDDLSNIRSVPTFKFFINKELKYTMKGVDKEKFKENLKELIKLSDK